MQNFPYQKPVNAPPTDSTLANVNFWSKGIMSLVFGFAVFNSATFIFPQPTPDTVSTTGTITEFQPADGYRLPVFTFQANDGKSYSVNHEIPFSEFIYETGQNIEVNYNSTEPSQAWIKNDPLNLAYNWLAQIIGGYYVFVGLFIIFLKLKKIPNTIIATLHRGIAGITYGVCAILAYPLMDKLMGYAASNNFPPALLEQARLYLPWIVSLIGVSGFIVIVITIISVRNSLMKYVPPTI